MLLCEGKKLHVSYASAEREARRLNRRHSRATHPYRCHACRAWHVGS